MTTVEIWGARAGQTQSRLFEEIRQCREAGQRVLLLVPEQYTLQAERELVEQLNLPGLLDLDVPTVTGKTLGESGADLDRMFLISSAITKAFRGDNSVHARYMMAGEDPASAETMSLNLSPDEQRLVTQALAEQRIRLGSQAEGEEKLLRRMTGSVTEYMDAAGLADRLTESDRALLAQHDGAPEAAPVMGGMQL